MYVSITLTFYIIRFIYVRYASGLVKEGIKLLHWLTILLITIFCARYKVINSFLKSQLFLISNLRSVQFFLMPLIQKSYNTTLTGKFCMKLNVSSDTDDIMSHTIQWKMISAISKLLYIIALSYFFLGSLHSK